jgi:hypothetical protein
MSSGEIYTLVHRGNFGSVSFAYFSDREKMKQEILRHINRGEDCYILPGQIEMVGFHVKYGEDGHSASGVYMEDEPDYVIPTKVVTVVYDTGLVEKFTKEPKH